MRHKCWSWIFVPFLFAALRTSLAQPVTTQVSDTIYHADGTAASGTALISWPAFTSGNGDQVPAGSTSVVLGSGGSLSVRLVPNSGAVPIGTYYTVTYHLDDNSVTRQYWVVPQSASPVRVAGIESTVLPVSVAMQTVSKSYVDTAIAAASGGHPLDTTPLVLKAGDTMTGPLQLPADPVSAMQAATKHYVDTAVAANAGSGGSGLTGQTPNSLPLATSATASTTSSHFWESGFLSGVSNTFLTEAYAPHCFGAGNTFIQFSCNSGYVFDDGTTPDDGNNLTGWVVSMNAGGGGGKNGVEGRVTTLHADSNNAAIATPGIKQGYVSNTSFFGIGDVAPIISINNCNSGVAYGSDEGCEDKWLIGQQRILGGGARGYFTGTINGGTNTQPTFTNVGGCTAPYNQACVPSPGAHMIDISAPAAAGKFTGATSIFTTGGINWLQTAPTNQTNIPISTAWGYKINAGVNPGAHWDAPVPTTFTLDGGAGTFAVGDHACMIGSGFEEQNVISAVSGSSPTQTITMPLSMPEYSVAIFKGNCQSLSLDADLDNLDVRYAFPAVSIDGVNLIFSVPAYSGNQINNLLPYEGAMWAQFDGGANSGFHTYYSARVTKIGTTSPNYAPFTPGFLQVFLEPNSAFNTGDFIENPDFPSQNITGHDMTVLMNDAPRSDAQLTGIHLRLEGPGSANESAGIIVANEQAQTVYGPWGGRLTPPHAVQFGGPFQDLLVGNYTPTNAIFSFSDHQPGQTAYTILSDPAWGVFSINGGGFNFSRDIASGSLRANGEITADLEMTTHLGVEMLFPSSSGLTPTGLVPCSLYPFGGGHGTDLCVTSQGGLSTRPSYDVTADRGLQVGNLTINGTCTGCPGGLAGSGTSGYLPLFTGSTALGNSPLDFGITAANTLTYSSNYNGDYVFVVNNDANTTSSSAGQRICYNHELSTCTGIYTVAPARVASGVVSPLSTYFGSAFGLTGGMSFNTETSAPIVFGTDNTARLTLDGTTGAATFSGAVNAAIYQGPAIAPTGSCSAVGWAFSQDGHISFCDGTSWAAKL